jgi:alanyl-tRNA synthetase
MLSDLKGLEKKVEQLKAKLASEAADSAEADMKTINGTRVLARKVLVDNPAALRELADQLKEKIKSGIIALGSAAGPKVLLIVIVTKDLLKRYHAGDIVKQMAAVVGGGGGGRPDMAQAGGSRPEKLDAAIEKVYEVIEQS